MSKKNVEADVEKALEYASLEYISKKMEEVDHTKFKKPGRMSGKRMEKKVMKTIGKRQTGGQFNIVKFAACAAAAVLAMGGLTMTFNEEVRASVFKMFSFIPNKGIVEVEDPLPGVPKAEDTLVMTNSGEKAATDDLSVTIESAVMDKDTLKVIYHVEMLSLSAEEVVARTDAREDIFAEDSFMKEMEKLYKEKGYDKYFVINENRKSGEHAIKGIHSALLVNGTEKQPVRSEVLFEEASGERLATVTEEYNISEEKVQGITEATIKVVDCEVPFKLEAAETFDSPEAVVAGKNTCTKNGITIMCEPRWEDQYLIADFYVLNTGSYKAVSDIWPGYSFYDYDAKSEYPYAEVNGKRVEGYCEDVYTYNGIDGKPFRMSFEVAGTDAKEVTIHLPSLMVYTNDEVTVEIPQPVGDSFDIFKEYPMEFGTLMLNGALVLTGDEAEVWTIPEMGMSGDVCSIAYQVKDRVPGQFFQGFDTTVVDGTQNELTMRGADAYLIAVLNKSGSQAKSITFKDACVRLEDDYSFVVSK